VGFDGKNLAGDTVTQRLWVYVANYRRDGMLEGIVKNEPFLPGTSVRYGDTVYFSRDRIVDLRYVRRIRPTRARR
jgi:uncharacterized protein YegJ (DUF2314 family)